MIFVIVDHSDTIIQKISCNSIDDLAEIYTEHKIIESTGDETVGWKYVGGEFLAPPVW